MYSLEKFTKPVMNVISIMPSVYFHGDHPEAHLKDQKSFNWGAVW